MLVLFLLFFLMLLRPPRSTRTDTLFPYTTLFRSPGSGAGRDIALDDVPALVLSRSARDLGGAMERHRPAPVEGLLTVRSEEHTSELQSLMRNSYAVFCLKKKNKVEMHHKRIVPR